MPQKVLVILGTSRQGGATVDALLAGGAFDVYATTRSGTNAELEGKGVTCVPFSFDAASAKAALDAVDPALVFFTTLMGPSRDVEAAQGKLVVDAIKAKGSVEHVVYSSVAGADLAPDAVTFFKSKLDVEDYLKASGLSFSITRPVAFFDNFDDPANGNPLKRGACASVWPGGLRVPHVACRDIGKAAAALLADPAAWKGKTLDCAACVATGEDVAAALSDASGVACAYSPAPPPAGTAFAAMVDFFATSPFPAEAQIAAFRKVVPDALDARGWFEAKGAWADGTKFAPRAPAGDCCAVV